LREGFCWGPLAFWTERVGAGNVGFSGVEADIGFGFEVVEVTAEVVRAGQGRAEFPNRIEAVEGNYARADGLGSGGNLPEGFVESAVGFTVGLDVVRRRK
jgi:hypothetical protein